MVYLYFTAESFYTLKNSTFKNVVLNIIQNHVALIKLLRVRLEIQYSLSSTLPYLKRLHISRRVACHHLVLISFIWILSYCFLAFDCSFDKILKQSFNSYFCLLINHIRGKLFIIHGIRAVPTLYLNDVKLVDWYNTFIFKKHVILATFYEFIPVITEKTNYKWHRGIQNVKEFIWDNCDACLYPG